MLDLPTLISQHEIALPQNAPKPLPSKLWPRLSPTASGCWEFRGARCPTGYGRVRVDNSGRTTLAHRLAWELTHGEIPEGVVVRHRCDNPPCCNPDHLDLGSIQDNSDDCVARGRVARADRLPQTKLTTGHVLEMRKLRNEGQTYDALGRRFGVSASQARRIVRGERWGWVNA